MENFPRRMYPGIYFNGHKSKCAQCMLNTCTATHNVTMPGCCCCCWRHRIERAGEIEPTREQQKKWIIKSRARDWKSDKHNPITWHMTSNFMITICFSLTLAIYVRFVRSQMEYICTVPLNDLLLIFKQYHVLLLFFFLFVSLSLSLCLIRFCLFLFCLFGVLYTDLFHYYNHFVDEQVFGFIETTTFMYVW